MFGGVYAKDLIKPKTSISKPPKAQSNIGDTQRPDEDPIVLY